MKESQGSIVLWGEETFGPVSTAASVAARANREMAELVQAAIDGAAPEMLAGECADAAICVLRFSRFSRDWVEETLGGDWHPDASAAGLALAASENLHAALVLSVEAAADAAGRDAGLYAAIDASLGATLRLLTAVCNLAGRDLGAEIDAKMAINRKRSWKLDGRGHGQHVDSETADLYAALLAADTLIALPGFRRPLCSMDGVAIAMELQYHGLARGLVVDGKAIARPPEAAE